MSVRTTQVSRLTMDEQIAFLERDRLSIQEVEREAQGLEGWVNDVWVNVHKETEKQETEKLELLSMSIEASKKPQNRGNINQEEKSSCCCTIL